MAHEENKSVFVNIENVTIFRKKSEYTTIGFLCGNSLEVLETTLQIKNKIKESILRR